MSWEKKLTKNKNPQNKSNPLNVVGTRNVALFLTRNYSTGLAEKGAWLLVWKRFM